MKTPIKSLFENEPEVKPVDSNTTPRRKCKTVVVAGKEVQVEVKK